MSSPDELAGRAPPRGRPARTGRRALSFRSCALVSQLSGEPRRRMARALETIFQVVAIGVDVPDLAPRTRLLAVQVHAQPRVTRQGVRVAVVQRATGAAEDVDHH